MYAGQVSRIKNELLQKIKGYTQKNKMLYYCTQACLLRLLNFKNEQINNTKIYCGKPDIIFSRTFAMPWLRNKKCQSDGHHFWCRVSPQLNSGAYSEQVQAQTLIRALSWHGQQSNLPVTNAKSHVCCPGSNSDPLHEGSASLPLSLTNRMSCRKMLDLSDTKFQKKILHFLSMFPFPWQNVFPVPTSEKDKKK